MCKRGYSGVLEILYRVCVEERHFPREREVARVSEQLKSIDKHRTNARSYRSISLLPAFGKIVREMCKRVLRLFRCT